MKITIGFSKHKGFAPFSWGVMLVEGTPFSHSYLSFYSDSLERKLIYHATGIGINFIGEERFKECNEVIKEFELEITDVNKNKMLRWCVDETGKPYSKTQILGLFVKKIASLFGYRISNPFKDGESAEICTEAVARALKAAGYKVPEQKDLDSMGLKCVYKMMEDNNL